jgi:SAM-dependent methyltransferase
VRIASLSVENLLAGPQALRTAVRRHLGSAGMPARLELDARTRARFRSYGAAIAALEFSTTPGEPTPKGYYRDALGPPGPERDRALDKQLRFYLDLFEAAGRAPHGLKVLEVGSGFGLGLVVVATLGAAEANGVEIVPWQVADALRMREVLPPDVRERVKPVVGDAIRLPYADGTLDVVLSLEAISHYLDHLPFIGEAHRVLRPGGVLVISDENNGLNPIVRRRTHRVWEAHEADPLVEAVDPDSPWLFVPKRERIVMDACPTLPSGVAHALALRTAGMVRAEIQDAARAYVDHGVLPDAPYRPGTVTVHPEHEMVMERPFNPFRLGREIAERGFAVRVRGHWGGAGGSRPVRLVDGLLRSLSRVTMPAARSFRIYATKV